MSKEVKIKFSKSGEKDNNGFSMVELLLALAITLVILGVAVVAFTQALSMRASEGSRTDALTSVQAAINIMSREISNSGFGLKSNIPGVNSNGIIVADSNKNRLHFRTNTTNTYPSNTDPGTINPGEDITYYWDSEKKSVVRYDANTGLTSAVINRVSDVEFGYFDYTGSTTNTDPNDVPTDKTGRIKIKLTVFMPDIVGQPKDQKVQFESDVTLRNSTYMLSQY